MNDFPHAVVSALLRTDFVAFVHKVFTTVNPGVVYLENWHIHAIAHEVMEMIAGRNHRLIVNMPPRYGKSLILSVALPAWLLGRNPATRIICVSYATDLALKFARDFRRVLQEPWYRAIFPGTRIARNTDSELDTTRRGYRYATSVGGTLTGRGGEWLIIDDPLKQDDAESETKRSSANEWFFNTAASRLDNRKEGNILVVMQRLHQFDLSGVLLEGGGYRHLSLPAIAEEEQRIAVGQGHYHFRKAGELLHPELEPLCHLDNVKQGMGSRIFAAQYQQSPVPPDGNMFKLSWLETYNFLPSRGYDVIPVISVDTAIKTTAANDFSVAMVFLFDKKQKRSYLVDVIRKRLEFPELKRMVVELHVRHNPEYLLIEDKGPGSSLIQELKREGIHPKAILPKLEKIQRAEAITPALERGELLLPATAAWLSDFRTEIGLYPQSRHDDQVDALSQYLNWVVDGTRPTGGIAGTLTSGHRR